METVLDLKCEIEARLKRKDETRERIAQFCHQVYGIADFFSLVNKFFPSDDNAFFICLARQIPTINIEHVAFHLLPQWLSVTLDREVVALPLAFARDSYAAQNKYKKSLIKLPWLRRGRNGRFIHCQNILALKELKDGTILGQLKTVDGRELPEFHQALRSAAFGENKTIEVSLFHRQCLIDCLRNKKRAAPLVVYRRVGEREVRAYSADVSITEDIRPSAEWFYLFHLMLFLDGQMGLLSTIGDDPEVERWFSGVIETIERVAGVKPLIIPVPKEVEVDSFKSELLEYPQLVLDSAGWQDLIAMPPFNPRLPIFIAKEHLEKKIIGLV